MWSEDCPGMQEGTHVNIMFGEPCGLMLTLEQHTSLAAHSGLGIEGIVTRNWNTDQAGPDDA